MKKDKTSLAANEALRKGKKKRQFRDNFEFLMIAAPGIIHLLIFSYIPMFGIIIAFKNFNPNKGVFGSAWNGFENFEFFFTSPDALRIIRNTVLYSLDFMILGMICAVGLALMFYCLKSRAALKTYNTIVILPRFISMVLIAYIVYTFLNPASGVLNRVLAVFNPAMKDYDWYANPGVWPFVLTFVHEWQTVGMSSIVYYASLMGIDDSLFEAAELDGANRRQQIWHVAIPHLIPIITIQTILAFGGIFSGDFGLFYQTTRNIGLLYPTTDIINTYVFRALKDGNMSVSAATGLVQSVLGLIMVVGVNLIVRKISPENSLF